MYGFRPLAAALVAGCVSLAHAAPATAAAGGEPAITVGGVEGDYLRAVHQAIHAQWTKVVAQLQRPGGPTGAAGAGQAVVLFSVRWDGTISGINLTGSSGSPAVDKSAVAAVRAAAPFRVPPVDLYSDDGVAHFRWGLSPDHRLCSDAQLRRKEDPLDEALPRLFIQGRVKEALLRVVRRRGTLGGGGDPLAVFAQSWLARPNPDPVADVIAAAALAKRTAGAERTVQLNRLSVGLARRETVEIAAAAMRELQLDVCEPMVGRLRDGDAAARELALAALKHGAADLSGETPCGRFLAAIVGDGTMPGKLRVSALNLLVTASAEAARRPIADALKDADPAVRGAALVASTRPGVGKAALYRLSPLLRDPSPEIRGAAAAGLVRAGGEDETFLEQTFPLVKEHHPRVLAIMAPELGRLSSERTAKMLGSFLRIADADLRVAVVAALAARQDEAARALLAPVLESARHELRAPAPIRALAFATAGTEQLVALAADPELAVRAVESLLRDQRPKEASDLLIAHFDRFSAAQMATLLGTWLSRQPASATGLSAQQLGGEK